MRAKLLQSRLTLYDPMDCSLPVSSFHGILQARMNTGVGSHALLQGIFPTLGWKLGLLHCRQILYQWATWKAPKQLYSNTFKKKFFFNVKRKGILTHALTWVNLEDMMSRGNKPVTKGPKLLVRRLKLQELIVPLRCPIHHLSPNAECSIWTTGDAQQWTKKCQRNGWVQIWSSGR